MSKLLNYLMIISFTIMINSCNQSKTKYQMGSYGYDKAFLEQSDVEFIELKGEGELDRVLIVPAYQGRIMTSTAAGDSGMSFGWMNYKVIESGDVNPQFNVYGGEERFWIGPEGGPYSIYFKPGEEQVYANWRVPPVIDTEGFDIVSADDRSARFSKQAELINASGTIFKLAIDREVSLLSKADIREFFNITVPEGVSVVAYQTDNTITNVGDNAWTKENGLLSIWLLSMFNPSPETTVFIPYTAEAEGVIVNDEYFGKVPSDRLIIDTNAIYFKIDGKYRSKIGVPPQRAKELCGSYDSGSGVLTLLWCTLPVEPKPYVNSQWGVQDDPYSGDVINSYNDGPVEDGSIMGPFYEIETSSPAADLPPLGVVRHIQRIVHIQGNEDDLAGLVSELFGLDLNEISGKF
jgi:hypothetical protein